jgi:hypothetical protein
MGAGVTHENPCIRYQPGLESPNRIGEGLMGQEQQWGPPFPKRDEVRVGLPFPTVRLEVEGMRHSIITAIANANRDIEEYLEHEIPNAILAMKVRNAIDMRKFKAEMEKVGIK